MKDGKMCRCRGGSKQNPNGRARGFKIRKKKKKGAAENIGRKKRWGGENAVIRTENKTKGGRDHCSQKISKKKGKSKERYFGGSTKGTEDEGDKLTQNGRGWGKPTQKSKGERSSGKGVRQKGGSKKGRRQGVRKGAEEIMKGR